MIAFMVFIVGMVIFAGGMHCLKMFGLNWFRAACGIILLNMGGDMSKPGFDHALEFLNQLF